MEQQVNTSHVWLDTLMSDGYSSEDTVIRDDKILFCLGLEVSSMHYIGQVSGASRCLA